MVQALAVADGVDFSLELPYGPAFGDPGDGILVLQNPQRPRELAFGSLWRVEPRNVGALTEAAVRQMAQSLEILFKSLQPGVTIQTILHMAPTDRVPEWTAFRGGLDTAAADKLSLNTFQEASIKEGLGHVDGTRHYRLKESTTLIGVRMTTPVSASGGRHRALSLMRSEAKLIRQLNDELEAALRPYVDEFKDLWDLCESVFGMAELGHERLGCAGIHREIARLLHPFRRQYRCYNPELPMRRQLLALEAENRAGGWNFGPDDETGDSWQVQMMSLQEAPGRTFPGMLSSLHTPPDTDALALWEVLPDTPLTIVTQVGVPDQRDERSRLRQKRNFAYMQRNTLLGGEDPEKVRMREDLDVMLRNTSQHILHTRVHVAFWHRADKMLTSTLAAATQAGRRLDLDILPENILGSTVFLQSLPLGVDLEFPKDRMMRRSRRISSLAAAHLLPVYGDFTGTRTPAQFYVNRRGEAVTCDLFDASTAPHTIIAGKSRSGKSFLVNHLIQQVLPLGASVVILDRWASYDTTCEVYGGEYVDVDLDSPLCFNPFAGDLQAGHRSFLLAVIDQMASGTSGSDAIGLGQIEKAVCSLALQAFAEWHEKERPGEEPLLGDFYNLLLNPTFDDQGRAGAIALRISQYVGKGEYAGFVDGKNKLKMSNALSIFELAKLEKAADLQSVLLLTLMYRLMQFITNPATRTQRKYLILDEVWALLKHDSAAGFLEEAARALARFRCCAIFMSQQMSDFKSAASQAIKNNSGNYVFLQQNPEEIGTLQEVFELSDQEVRLLHLVHVRDNWSEGYLWQPEGKGGVIRLVPDPFTRWLVSQKPDEKAARVKLNEELGDLGKAVAVLAGKYPSGLPRGVTV